MMRVEIVVTVSLALLCCTYGSETGYRTKYEKNMEELERESDYEKWKYGIKSTNFYSDVMEDKYSERTRRSVQDLQKNKRNKIYLKRNVSRMHQNILTEVVGKTLVENISTPISNMVLKNTQVSTFISIVGHHLLFELEIGIKRMIFQNSLFQLFHSEASIFLQMHSHPGLFLQLQN